MNERVFRVTLQMHASAVMAPGFEYQICGRASAGVKLPPTGKLWQAVLDACAANNLTSLSMPVVDVKFCILVEEDWLTYQIYALPNVVTREKNAKKIQEGGGRYKNKDVDIKLMMKRLIGTFVARRGPGYLEKERT